jgi:hypothetical protein
MIQLGCQDNKGNVVECEGLQDNNHCSIYLEERMIRVDWKPWAIEEKVQG